MCILKMDTNVNFIITYKHFGSKYDKMYYLIRGLTNGNTKKCNKNYINLFYIMYT